MAISSSVRALYRLIGRIIGRNVSDRLANDDNISKDPEFRSVIAQELVDTITALRHELGAQRDFTKLHKIIQKLFAKDSGIAIKQFAWILEAYLLLNQSSSACVEATKVELREPDRLWASKLVDNIRTRILQEHHLAKIFDDKFSTNLVLTAHPTAGIQRDYLYHIKNMVNSIEEISSRIEPSEWQKIGQDSVENILENNVKDILEDLNLSISHMVRSKPYNSEPLTPIDESVNFLVNIEEAWTVIPAKVQALEAELRKYLGNNFRLNENFFKLHSWVARDIDGNPKVTKDDHLKALQQETLSFARKYLVVLKKLWQKLADDFTIDKDLPSKTYFRDVGFESLYKEALELSQGQQLRSKPYQAYRMVLEHIIIARLDKFIHALSEDGGDLLDVMNSYQIERDLLEPLELIRANKEYVNTKEIDLIIRKLQIFGLTASWGHTRQGRDILNELLFALVGKLDDLTAYILKSEPSQQELLAKVSHCSPKVQQTSDILSLYPYGGIRRQIISMNQGFEDMLNTLAITKIIGAFKPAVNGQQPESKLEIVPLTERISDLRNSYKVMIDALSNPAWNQYLVSQQGRFITMRGPSDSAKQNGFMASQWEMFRSKQFDSIVVEIFNSYLNERHKMIDCWRQLALDSNYEEAKVITAALERFDEFFVSADYSKKIWANVRQVTLVNFDGWGEPVERGGGLEFETTVKCTQPSAANPYYERTLQGGGAQQLASNQRTRLAMKDLLEGMSEIAVRRFVFDRTVSIGDLQSLKDIFTINPDFSLMMRKLELVLRQSLRNEVFGLELDDDNGVYDEDILRGYFSHVIKSPLVFLDLFNIASRPASRSGTKIKELLDDPKYANDLHKLAQEIPLADITKVLGDIRAIPYAAMFSLLGGNHVSFYGFDKILIADEKFMSEASELANKTTTGKKTTRKTLLEWIEHFYHAKEDSQERRLLRHMIDSLERGIITADHDCYRYARELLEQSYNPNYKSANDKLIFKFINAQQATLNFVAAVKHYKVKHSNKVQFTEILQADPEYRDLMIARRNDAAVPRLGIALAMAEIFGHCRQEGVNPLSVENIPNNLLDLLRKAFAAGASTFGNGCID